MSSVDFGKAFERWYTATETERARLDTEKKRGGTNFSHEALDHLCGLAVESGMKALMFHQNLIKPDKWGDFPEVPINGTPKRPHINELWDVFISKASGHKIARTWVSALGGGKNTPVNVFLSWRTEHRYAPDGTVPESAAIARLEMAKRLKRIAEDEGL